MASVQEDLEEDVANVVEMCSQIEYLPEGSVLSFGGKVLCIPSTFTGLSKAGNRLGVTPMWPQSAQISKHNVEGKAGLFSLQTGANDAVVCQVNARGKCIQDVSIHLEDTQCILLDASCSGSVLQNVTFQGTICSMFLACTTCLL